MKILVQIASRDIEVTILRKHIRHTYLRYRGGELQCSAPYQVSEADIRHFIALHAQTVLRWIDLPREDVFSFEEGFPLFGRNIPVTIEEGPTHVFYEGNSIKFRIQDKDRLPSLVLSFYAKQTVQKAHELCSIHPEWVALFQIRHLKLSAQAMKTRLGSCRSDTGSIRLNSLLARYDVKYLEAILVHELAHLRIAGHQANFYRLVEQALPDYHERRKAL
ncbi:MAG: DUF45 domain-containing protein, partial [Candidatus Izemoplasmatales bacterium]|nr:DUF45 domain-containing protein [Candidatus Izemoplasmatales bacterium]